MDSGSAVGSGVGSEAGLGVVLVVLYFLKLVAGSGKYNVHHAAKMYSAVSCSRELLWYNIHYNRA